MVGNITNSISVRWRLLGFIFFLLLMMIGAGTGGILGMKGANKSLSSVYEDYVQPMEELRQLNELFKFEIAATAERVLYEHISFTDALNTVAKTKVIINNNWLEIIEESKRLPNNQELLDSATKLAIDSKDMIENLSEILQSKDMDKLDILFNTNLEPFQKEYEAKINDFILQKVLAIKAEYAAAEKRYKISQKAFIVTIILGTIFGLVVGFLIMRSIDVPLGKITRSMDVMMKGDLSRKLEYEGTDEFGTLINGFNQMQTYLSLLVGQIQNAGIQVTSSITEIAASIKQQEVTANEHAATANEIAASTNEIAATSAHLQQTMDQVNSLTASTAHAAKEGHAGLAGIDKTMAKMEEATGTIVAKLSVLSEKASDIAGVVKTINKVADQTNLLSLNAAIEAEKAGEYGAGFAVVATEIRRLADQTAVATYDIEQMVKGVQSAVSSTVMGIDKFAEDVRSSTEEIREGNEQLEGVIANVQLLMPQVTNVSEGIETQSLGARQISEATGQLNEGAQQSAESVSQMSSTINQLQIAAQSLQEAITKFKVV